MRFKTLTKTNNNDRWYRAQTQKHPEYTGPALGPKMADKNERTFTEDQLRASEGHLNLQMGFNKGASQSGLGSFGNTRHM